MTSPLRLDLALPALTLACAARVPAVRVRGWWWGPQADVAPLTARVATAPDDPADADVVVHRTGSEPAPRAGDPSARLSQDIPTVLVVHALTGDSRVAGSGGWWSDRVGHGLPIDPRVVRVLCFNNLGSCYGTTGPADHGFPSLADVPGVWPEWDKGTFDLPESALPAPITTWDQARVILGALDALGIDRVDLLVGGSVGGMVALCLAALAPARFPRLVPIATVDRATPWIVGWNHIARQVLAAAYRTPGGDPTRALSLARQVAHMTYRAGPGLAERHGRRMVGTDAPWSPRAPYSVQTYLQHQGDKLVARFDPRAYLSQLDAMDHHDLSVAPPAPDPWETWTPGGADWPGEARITARLDTVGIDSDTLFFAADLHALVTRHRARGRDATWSLLRSPHGHDAFLMPSRTLDAVLRDAVRRIDPARFP